MGRTHPFPCKEVLKFGIGRELAERPIKFTGVDPRRDKDTGDPRRVRSRHVVVKGVSHVGHARRVGDAQPVQTGLEMLDVRLSAPNTTKERKNRSDNLRR